MRTVKDYERFRSVAGDKRATVFRLKLGSCYSDPERKP